LTTFLPLGTSPSQIADELGRALDGQNRPAATRTRSRARVARRVGSVHAGTVNAPGGPRIGIFYPTVGETVMPDIVRALIALLGP
jgi:hypothetical protein